MSRKLKVFHAQIGFYDTVVAAPSQAAALRAWGVHQNLFAAGEARLATDEAAIAAATARPEVPLRRALGSKDAFAVEASSLPKVPPAPKAKPAAKRKPAKPERPPADRSKLDAAEAALKTLDEARKREEAELARAQAELDARRQAAQSAYVEARKAATAKVVETRGAYRKAGRRD